MKSSGDLQLLKRINRSVLLRLIRFQPEVSRARLAELSGLTKSTVSSLVRELLDEHWLTEAPKPVAIQGLGRPSTPLCMNNHTRVLIGVEIAVDYVRVVGVSLAGSILTHTEEPLQGNTPHSACQQVAQLVGLLCAQLKRRKLLLTGVGVSLPGAVDDITGVVHLAPNLGWRNIPLHNMIAQALEKFGIVKTNIFLQNEADAAALSEYEFGAYGDSDSLVFVMCDIGVGAGVILNDCLFTGNTGLAGEIGHSILQINGPVCSCGRRGCVETFIGARALESNTNLDTAGDYLGMVLHNLDAAFNPRVIVLGGRSCFIRPGLIGAACRTLNDYARAAGLKAPEVRPARYGLQAAAVGAAALVLHHYLRPVFRDKKNVLGN
jgi:predicted NBD/HSP70 family sugar kinase